MTPELQTRRTDVGIASLATNVPELEAENVKRKVHYLWFPYVDIPIVGPDGLRMRLGKGYNYYGVGRPGDDFGMAVSLPNRATRDAKPRPPDSRPAETADEYNERFAGLLKRCDPLPIWNITYQESRFNHGKFSDEEWNAGNSLIADLGAEEVEVPAGVCAADFLLRYEVSHGARVLLPLIGMDDSEMGTALELVKLVQPKPYKLTNLPQEREQGFVDDPETLIFDLSEHGPADMRIRSAKLDKTLERKAHELRAIKLGGVRQAIAQAYTDWENLLTDLSNSAMGHSGHKKSVSHYDRQVAWLIGETAPASIAMRPSGDPDLKKNVDLLTQAVANMASKQPDSDVITVRQSDLQSMIDEAVERRLAQDKGKKGKTE